MWFVAKKAKNEDARPIKKGMTKSELTSLHLLLKKRGMLPCDVVGAGYDGKRNLYFCVFVKGKKQVKVDLLSKHCDWDCTKLRKQLTKYFVGGKE